MKVCTAGLVETTSATNSTIKYAHTFDEARQWIGNIGDVGIDGPKIDILEAVARDKSKQGIGYVSADFVRDFFFFVDL